MKKIVLAIVLCAPFLLAANECGSAPVSDSGIRKASVQVQTGADGLTAEQHNVRERLMEDNKPGAIKHLYGISPFSGQAIIYSTVKGKVTSGGKRLTPSTIAPNGYQGERVGFRVAGLGGAETGEVLQDDGTYGSSSDYLYWWDTKGIYHQLYPNSLIIHISSQPMPVKGVLINLSGE